VNVETESKPVSTAKANHNGELISFVTKEDVLTSEIWWTSKMVTSHFSFHSNIGISDLFRCMFPDSSIASKFSLSETKARYITAFGLGPCFLDMLKQNARAVIT
jgi:hypothetical protein